MRSKTNKIIENIEKIPLSRKFHLSTNILNFNDVTNTPKSKWPSEWKKVSYKAYPRLKNVQLPGVVKLKTSFFSVLLKRKSTRKFSKQPLPGTKFSTIMYYTAGINYIDQKIKRFYPSGGARYPLEVYPLIFSVNGIKPGLYHYHVKTNSLELLQSPISKINVFKQFNQSWLKNSSVLLLITAVFDRTENKYKNRGYRHILTEYGHMAQNTYLIGSSLNVGVCSIGGFVDMGLNKIIDIDGIDESVIGVIALGNIHLNS